MGSAALPGRSGKVRGDRLDKAGVSVGGHQLHPGKAAGDEVDEKRVPGGGISACRGDGRLLVLEFFPGDAPGDGFDIGF